ncbi:fibroblast growth factor receptor homolog 1 [Eurosta solidaginis]|uniref:fibroblast growth factor receptor homolog 1 n=1 Tax=Eurosta solidaginis TaxID=178769 RepID=UPI0035309100
MTKIRLKSFFYEPPNLSLSLLIITIICYSSSAPYLTLAKSLGGDSQAQHSAHSVYPQRIVNVTLSPSFRHTKRVVAPNTEVHLMCMLSGMIKWYKDEEFLSANRLLVLKEVQRKDAGVYSCQAVQVHLGPKYVSVALKVLETAAEQREQKLIRAETETQEDIADFSKVEDEADARLRWEENDDDDDILDEAEEETTTQMIVLKTSNNTAFKFVHLPNSGPPQFQQSYKLLENVTQALDSLVQLSCPAFGNPLPIITWWHNNTKMDLTSIRFRLKKWTLFIEQLAPGDAGVYTCKVSNKFGTIDHNIRLDIVEPRHTAIKPRIVSVLPANQTLLVNSSARLECAVEASTPVKLGWLKHKQPISVELDLSNFSHSLDVSPYAWTEQSPAFLEIPQVQLADEGFYTCMGVNDVGQAMATTYLRVVAPRSTNAYTPLNTTNLTAEEHDTNSTESGNSSSPTAADHEKLNAATETDAADTNDEPAEPAEVESAPRFKKTDKDDGPLHKPAGATIQLACAAHGNPMPNITWTRSVGDKNFTEIMRHIGKVTYKKWSMHMDDVIAEDSGTYKCTVCNKLGCIERLRKLTIMDRLRSRPIHSDKFPQNQTVLNNSSAYFECRVVSDLEPHIYWIKYKSANMSIDRLERLVSSANANTNSDQHTTKDYIKLMGDPDKPNVLRLENVTHADEGWYTCVAANRLGESLASAYLHVVDKLPSREVYLLWRAHPVWTTMAVMVIVLLFLFGSIFIIYVLRKLKHEKLLKHRIETVHQWTKKVIIYKPASSEGSSCDLHMPVIKIEKQRTTFQASNMDPSQAFNEYEFPLDSNWEIPRTQLNLGSTLGEGAFGRVVMADACNLSRTAKNTSSIVAVKMVKEEHTDADMASLVREMEVMKMIGKHINIINLLGCCTQNGPLWVIVEFAPHGNLKDFLKKNRPLFVGSPSLQRSSDCLEDMPQLTEKNLVSFAFQIARGMEYLASRRCIHRDLAARNVLVSDDYVMKIADFGLARDIQDTDYYRKNTNGRLPIKWMAPESLQEKFYDSQSDVWSYGVLLWEIMTFGEQPYPNIMSAEELYSYLITGKRMEKPARCSLNIYMLMRQCWHFDANVRPTFVEIVENLDKILQLASNHATNEEYLDLSMPMLETPPSSSDDESEADTFQETSPLRYQYTYKCN